MKLHTRSIIILRRVLLGFAVVATLAASFYTEENLRGDIAWRRFKEQRAASGRPLDPAYYMPSRIPDAENLFKADIFAKLSSNEGWTKFQKDSYHIWDFWTKYGHWQKALLTDFKGSYAILTKGAPRTEYPGDKAAAAVVLDQFSSIGSTLDAVCDAAVSRPRSQLSLRRNGVMEMNFAVTRSLGFALAWRASSELEIGRYDLAYRDAYAGLRLVEGPLAAPLPTWLAMGGMLANRALQPIWEGCSRAAWNDAQLASFQAVLSKLRPLRDLPNAIDFEIALTVPSGKEERSWMPGGWSELSAIKRAKFSDEYELSTFDANSGRMDSAKVSRALAFASEATQVHSPIERLALAYWWPMKVRNVGAGQCAFILAETACAVERYKLGTGKFPNDLAALVPRFMTAVPSDPIDGALLRYSLLPDGRYILYSIGSNGIDDHGAMPTKLDNYYPWHVSTGGDWVWPEAKTG